MITVSVSRMVGAPNGGTPTVQEIYRQVFEDTGFDLGEMVRVLNREDAQVKVPAKSDGKK